MAVSQSNTMWVKKGTVVNGKKVKKGYVAQKGKPEKRVTNKIKLVVDTDKRGKAGETVTTKKGRYVKSNKKVQVTKPKSKGGGYTGSGPAGGKTVVKQTSAPPRSKRKRERRTTLPKKSRKRTPVTKVRVTVKQLPQLFLLLFQQTVRSRVSLNLVARAKV